MPTSALKASRPERSPLPNGTTLKLRSLDTDNELTTITKCTITGLLSKEGGSGLVYEATDDYNTKIEGEERNLIIKECYPLANVEVGGSEKSLASLLIRDPQTYELSVNKDLEESWKSKATKVFDDYKQHFEDAFGWHRINASRAPNQTAPLLGFSEENNTVYIISSRQEGMSLKELYGSRVGNFTSALAILISLCELLEFYHEKGYVYLDVKPDNIFCLTKIGRHPSGEISFFDFDTVQLIADLKSGKWGAPRGSIGYAPREQRNKAEVRNISERSDIYSVGATLHWLVTGNKPDAEDDLLTNRATYEWKPKKDLELTFLEKSIIDSIFSNTLQDSYLERYKDMASLIAELKQLRDASEVELLSNLAQADMDTYIISREADCQTIKEELEEYGSCTIYGDQGYGKSELAKDYARRTFGKAYNTSIFLVADGSLNTTISSQLLLKKNGYVIAPEQGLEERLLLLRQTDEKTLIVLDNYSGIDSDDELEQKCKDALSREGGHHLIITQRKERKIDGPLKITPLSEDELVDLYFMNRGKGFERKNEEGFLREHFLPTVFNHTMIVVLAARIMQEKSNYSLEELTKELAKNLANAPQAIIEHEKDGKTSSCAYATHIAKLIDLSGLSETESSLLGLLSMLSADGVDQDLVASLCVSENLHEDSFDANLSSLIRLGWVKRRFAENSSRKISLHPLVSDVATRLLKEGTELEWYLEKLGNYLEEVRKSIDHSEKPDALSHGAMTVERCAIESKAVANTFSSIALTYARLSDYDEALKYHQKALAINSSILPEGHPSTAEMLSSIGLTYKGLGNYNKALECQLMALKISRDALPEGHPNIALLLNLIGISYRHLGNFDEALRYQSEALEIDRANLPESHLSFMASMSGVSHTYSALGSFDDALRYLFEMLEIERADLPKGRPYFGVTLYKIGVTYQALGNNDKAQEYFDEAKKILDD